MRSLRLLAPLLIAACAGSAEEDIDMFSFDDFADGKVDTGYLGSRAAEMEASFTSKLRVPLPGKTQAELESIATTLKTNPTDYSIREVVTQVSTHAKFARNALRAAKYNLNLESGEPPFTAVTVETGALVLEYTLKVESLVKYKDLEAMSLTPASLVGQQIEMKLPLVIDGLHARVGTKCSSDFDANGAASARAARCRLPISRRARTRSRRRTRRPASTRNTTSSSPTAKSRWSRSSARSSTAS
jgi:hypothetical protein